MHRLITRKPYLLFVLPLLLILFLAAQNFSPIAATALHNGKSLFDNTFWNISVTDFSTSNTSIVLKELHPSSSKKFASTDFPPEVFPWLFLITDRYTDNVRVPYRQNPLKLPASNHIQNQSTTKEVNHHRIPTIDLEPTDPYLLARQYNIYEKAITVVKNKDSLIPFRRLDTLSFATLAIGSKKGNVFQQYLNKYTSFSQFALPRMDTTEAAYESLLEALGNYQVVVISLHQLLASPLAAFGIPLSTRTFIERLRSRTQVALVVFGTPLSLKYFDRLDYLVCAYQDKHITQTLVPQILFGALPAKGRLPRQAANTLKTGNGVDTPSLKRLAYTVPEQVGLQSKTLSRIDRLVERCIDDEVMPGAQVLVAKNGKVIYEKAFGYLTYDKEVPVTTHTLYDLASVTKVAATVQAVMALSSKGMIDINRKASYYLPELKGTNKSTILIRDLLLHQAGLLAFQDHWTRTITATGLDARYYASQPDSEHPLEVAPGIYGIASLKDSIWQWTIDSGLLKKRSKGKKYRMRYSDIGFDILQRIVEKQVEQPLDVYLAKQFYQPLGLDEITFNPLHQFDERRIAPTEQDTRFRQMLLRGTVHDQQAALLGGVAGHAGLFGTANDLAALMQMNLQKGYYGGKQFFTENTLAAFTKTYQPGNHRALGWDRPKSKGKNYVSAMASRNTFGHTGFTGTCVWVDPDEQLVYIFLSNRVYPDVTNTKLARYQVRKKIQDIVYQSAATDDLLLAGTTN